MPDGVIRVLDQAGRCLLAFTGEDGPLIVPLAQWFDGQDAWMTAPSGSAAAHAIAGAPGCTLAVPADGRVVVASGEARLFWLGDPLRLALHAGPLSGALAALAARNAGPLLGYARHSVFAPARLLPHQRVVLRVRVGDAALLAWPAEPPGMAPPLPTDVPADVRRALAGERRVLVAHGGRALVPAVWGAGFTLSGRDGRALDAAGPVAVAVTAGAQGEYGAVLHGRLSAGRLCVRRATWWREFETATVDVPSAGVVLPD